MHLQMIFGFTILACVYAQVSQPPFYKEKYPNTYMIAKSARHPRDITWDKNVDDRKIFGTLDHTDDSVFAKATASKVWNFDKNTRLLAEGSVSQDLGHGQPDISGPSWNTIANKI